MYDLPGLLTRRRFLALQAAGVGTAGLCSVTQALAEEEAAAIPRLPPRRELTLCPWSARHPRHDHQLIFPLSDGRLLFVWSEYYTDDPKLLARKGPTDQGGFGDEMPCRISAMTSGDDGRTWGEPYVLQANEWKLNVKHPNLVRLGNREILFTFTGWDSMAQRNVYLRRSTDDGATWSERKQISAPGWYCTNNDHVLRLKSGRIVLPAHGVLGGGPYQGGGSKLESFMYLSDDGGRSWRRSADGLTAVGRGCHEPTVVELRDGRLLCYLRTTNACIYRSTSADGGDHWTVPEPTELIAPDSPPLLKRMPTGDLLLVWNRVASKKNMPRTPLTTAVSRDDGATWEHVRHLEPRADRDAAYASVYVHGDEALVCYYHRLHAWSRDTEVRLRAYAIDDFYRAL